MKRKKRSLQLTKNELKDVKTVYVNMRAHIHTCNNWSTGSLNMENIATLTSKTNFQQSPNAEVNQIHIHKIHCNVL